MPSPWRLWWAGSRTQKHIFFSLEIVDCCTSQSALTERFGSLMFLVNQVVGLSHSLWDFRFSGTTLFREPPHILTFPVLRLEKSFHHTHPRCLDVSIRPGYSGIAKETHSYIQSGTADQAEKSKKREGAAAAELSAAAAAVCRKPALFWFHRIALGQRIEVSDQQQVRKIEKPATNCKTRYI